MYKKTSLFDSDELDLSSQYLETDINSFESIDKACKYYYDYYKKHGYPNYNIDEYNPVNELNDLINFDESKINVNGELQQTMHSCGFLWCFFPNWIYTSTENGKSLYDNWNNEKKLHELIRKTVNYNLKHNNGIWTTNRIRQNAKVYCSKQTVSNFRPTVAKYIYNTFGNNGKIFDPCCGWGGRLLGFLSSNCIEYVGCDPSTETYNGLNTLKNIYSYRNKEVQLNNCCAEDYVPKSDYFDLVFTSPPYFNTEHYSNETTQSYLRYPDYEDWKNNFLQKLIENSFNALKFNGYFIFNIANVKTAPTLEQDSIKIAKDIGFEHVNTLKLVLSSISGKGTKFEPVFIFKKIKNI